MAQTKQLIATLKKLLKAHGYSYADVAKQLSLSEASVKRLFSECNISLVRLDKICHMMEIEISDLAFQMNNYSQSLVTELSYEQEQEIANDISLLLVAVCVLNRWSMSELMAHFHLSKHECIRYLVVLDKLKLVDLLPDNKLKLKVSPNFKWLDNGPIQQFFQQKVAADFFDTRFAGHQEKLIVINGMLGDEAMAIFQRKLTQLAHEFDELNREDASLPLEKRSGTTAVLAMRHWRYGLFENLRKLD